MRLRPPDQEKNASSKLKIMILPVGQVDMDTLNTIRNGLASAIPESACDITKDGLQIPEGAYNPIRHQYKSGIILAAVYGYAERSDAKRVLGVTNVDLYVPKLNFVFGEAQYLGKAAVISLHRLRPEFYKQQPNLALFKERAVKEAIHEIGHTLGLGHCPDPFCIMFFSNSILDTDRKRPVFCRSCHPLLLRRLEGM